MSSVSLVVVVVVVHAAVAAATATAQPVVLPRIGPAAAIPQAISESQPASKFADGSIMTGGSTSQRAISKRSDMRKRTGPPQSVSPSGAADTAYVVIVSPRVEKRTDDGAALDLNDWNKTRELGAQFTPDAGFDLPFNGYYFQRQT